MNATISRVTIRECTNPTELYCHYDGQYEPQGAYIALDLEDGELWADYNGEIGNGVPESVYHGRTRRYAIPPLTAEAANRVMGEIKALAERIVADSEVEWNGNNHVGVLGVDAQAAEEMLENLLGCGFDNTPEVFDEESDTICVWDIDGATNDLEESEYNITATTTDERLEEIADSILADLVANSPSGVAVCDGLLPHLKQLRDELANAEDDE